LHHEEAFAADGEVEFTLGDVDVALAHHPGRGNSAHTRADLEAGRNHGSGGRGGRTCPGDLLVEQVLELCAGPLVAGGAHVRDVVGDDFDVAFLSGHAGG